MRSLFPSAMIIASLALSANAFAADSPVKTGTAHAAHARVASHVVAKRVVTKHIATEHLAPRRPHALAQRPVDLGQIIQSLFSGGLAVGVSRSSPGTYEASPSYDYSTPVDTTPTFNDAQAAADAAAENEAIQSMNDTNAMTASMAAAEEQNDEANAATLQTEINAGM